MCRVYSGFVHKANLGVGATGSDRCMPTSSSNLHTLPVLALGISGRV